MDELTYEAIQNLLIARREIALKNLESSVKYSKVCERQCDREGVVDEIIINLETIEKQEICEYLEDEVVRTNYEIEEAYIQGLRDCFKLVGFLKGDEIGI